MLNRRSALLWAGASLAAPLAARAQGGSRPEAELDDALEEFFRDQLADFPETATLLGLDTGAEAGTKSRLHHAALTAVDQRKARTAGQLRRLNGIERSKLSGASAVNYDAVRYDLAVTDAGNRRFAYGYEGAGGPYVISQINGAWQDVPDFLASQHTIETEADAEAYVARLGEFARLMDEEVERVRHDAAMGVVPPDFAIAGALAGMKTLRAPASQSTLILSLVDRTKAKGVAGEWEGRATATYEGQVLPALERQMALLESLKGRAPHDAGVWRLPDGEAYYAQALQVQTTTTMTPAEVHGLGLDQARALSARADAVFRRLGMSHGTVAERFAAVWKDPKYVYPDTEAGKAKEIADMNVLVQAMQTRLPDYFATLPKAGLQIQRIPAATEASASTHYTDGSLDGSRPGIYWLNLRDMSEMPLWEMPTTAYHEGIPGHHLQGSLQRQSDLPMIRKASSSFNAYIEGWALYSEQLAQEMGLYADNPVGELGYLNNALLRAGRLVTDTGLHSLRWSREQAIEAMHNIDGDPPALAAQEIERYSVWPGQACSYMIGKITILGLREKAKAALGPRFDIRQFHDAVLLCGSLPLTVLENVVDSFIAARKA